MIRAYKAGSWASHLAPRDLDYLVQRIEAGTWYPMDTFERMGLAILAEIRPDMETVRAWGRAQVDWMCSSQPNLVVAGDTMDTLMRFRVLRASFFDYPALEVTDMHDGEASLVISYGMSARAEEAASWQTVGFFERLLELAGATDVAASFVSKSWDGDLVTTARLLWRSPAR
jgi:hypothetical protein